MYEQDSTYSRSFKSAFENLISEENLVKINSDACNFSKFGSAKKKKKPLLCLNKINDYKVNKLLLIPTSKNINDVDELIRVNSLFGSEKVNLLGSDSLYKPIFLSKNGKIRNDTKGMLVTVPWQRKDYLCVPDDTRLECKTAKLFRSQKDINPQERYEPLKINWRTATAYDATLALLNGLQLSRDECTLMSRNISLKRRNKCMRKKLKDELLSEKFKTLMSKSENYGALGVIAFDEYGDRLDNGGTLGSLVEIKDGKFQTYHSPEN